MSLVRNTDKRTGVTYVYESESYWDKEKQQPRSRRKLIGKIDPETGEIVATGKRGRKKKVPDNYADLLQYDDASGIAPADTEEKYLRQLKEKDLRISELEARVRKLVKERADAADRLKLVLKALQD